MEFLDHNDEFVYHKGMRPISIAFLSLLCSFSLLSACKPSATAACASGKTVFERCTKSEEGLRWADKDVQQCQTALEALIKKDSDVAKAWAESYKKCESMADCEKALPCAMMVRMGVDKALQ